VRLVLDTDVIVAALRSPRGASAAILRCLDDGRATLLLSVALALEYEAVCQLPEHRLVMGLTTADVEIFVNSLIAMAEPVEAHFRWRPALQDPADEMVLETAVNGNAAALVTFNQKHFKPVHSHFGIEVLQPREALKRMKS
jgi:putative PIN family toxin of toxin-antitoxin system